VAAGLVSSILVGGATAVFAATPAGQNLVHAMTGSAHATVVADQEEQINGSKPGGHMYCVPLFWEQSHRGEKEVMHLLPFPLSHNAGNGG
jgi:hypothetical protein